MKGMRPAAAGLACVALLGCAFAFGAEPKQEKVRLKNEREIAGYIDSDTKAQLVLKRLHERPGLRRMVDENIFGIEEIDRFEKLPAAERKKLADLAKAIEEEGKERERRLAAVAIKKGAAPSGMPLLVHKHKLYLLQ